MKTIDRSKREYKIDCKSETERNEWIKDMKKIIDEVTLKQDPSIKKTKQLVLSEWK